ncbi:MAG TPA: NnrS family protein [Verrucomicrobiae bacterium]|jgi:uncharacterized protein involved in response to NO
MQSIQHPTILAGNVMSRSFPLQLLAREPFRLFFPAATVAGIVGVALWPLHLLGFIANYPGQFHARIMAHGLFGGFIFGFLGTAMPRMLSARPLRGFEVAPMLAIYLASVGAYAFSNMRIGNALFLALIAAFAICMAPRIRERKDTPPPGFILVAFSLLSVTAGSILTLLETTESSLFFITLERLLTYQGFVLLPILGIGPFILPRFFGLSSAHDFPESLTPTRGWAAKAALATAAAAAIIVTFFMEAHGSLRLAYAIRFAAVLAYIILEFPFKSAPAARNVFGATIRVAVIGIVSGFLAIAFYPGYRVGLLHLTLIGGFAVITFVVATRVLFGHSGNLGHLKGRNRWFLIALGLMLFGMATRISGDFWPKIMASHYIYGAILWIVGVLLWAVYALPKVLVEDLEK